MMKSHLTRTFRNTGCVSRIKSIKGRSIVFTSFPSAPNLACMGRKLRVEDPEAIYDVVNRGDRREPIVKAMGRGRPLPSGWCRKRR